MSRLFEAYRAIHEQAFIPIFTENGTDSRQLVEACVDAGCKGIEYTLRRRDAPEIIPWIRESFPDLYIIAGSTLDSEPILRRARSRHPQLRSLKELVDMGVDGIASLVGFQAETVQHYSSTHLVVSPASTILEAFRAVSAGAHFVKLVGPSLDLVRLCRNEAGFGYCPILITGGMSLDIIPEAFSAGVALVGSGFDLMLKDKPRALPTSEVTDLLKRYLDRAKSARAKGWPELAKAEGGDRRAWLAALPHHHPFGDLK